MTLDEIEDATMKDNILQRVIHCIETDNWPKTDNDKAMATFIRLRGELTIVHHKTGKVLLCDKRLVIPQTLQTKVIQLAHEGHQGIVKTKQLIREKVWFPGVDKQVENICKSCIPCLASVPKTTTEPLVMSDLPDSVWSEVSIDFCGPFPTGEYLMVIIDDYSRYPVVEILTSISSRSVIPHMDKIFSMFGVPGVVKSDNGPPFNGSEFDKFSEFMGFKHRKITPLWPRANSFAERFMRTIGKSIRAAHAENRSWKQEMFSFLRNYRATPHSTTSKSPAELFFGRTIRTKIPEIPTKKLKDKTLRNRDRANKNKMKKHSDQYRHAVKSNLKLRDTVLVKQEKKDKLTTPFDPKPFVITQQKGSMITAERHDKQITRNSSHFKRVPKQNEREETTESEDKTKEETPILRRSTRFKTPPNCLKDYVTNIKAFHN